MELESPLRVFNGVVARSSATFELNECYAKKPALAGFFASTDLLCFVQ